MKNSPLVQLSLTLKQAILLSIGATEIIRDGHRTPENTIEYQIFMKDKNLFSL